MKKTNHLIPSIIFLFYIFLLLTAFLFTTSCSYLPRPKPALGPASQDELVGSKAVPVPALEDEPNYSAASKELYSKAAKANIYKEDKAVLAVDKALKIPGQSGRLREKSVEVVAAPVPKPKTAILKSTKAKKYKEYEVVLAVDKALKIPGQPGRLRVWIGIPNYKPNFPINMIEGHGTLPSEGSTAKITPNAPAFKVDPKESACVKIYPTGSEVGFTLTPIEAGTFDVGAEVSLYDSDDCSGTPIPRGTTWLQVKVVVDYVEGIKVHTKKFLEVFWEKLLQFWGELLVLLFAVILFLIRKKLKKWIGFGKDY